MNIDRLIGKYFKNEASKVSIEVFDGDSIYEVYSDIVRMLNGYPEIELTILQALSYCFYEILDNVLVHSHKNVGTVITSYNEADTRLKVLVADDGIGMKASLAENSEYADVGEADALQLCLKDNVTDGKGKGFGLYSTMQLVQHAGLMLRLHSGTHVLSYDGQHVDVETADEWKGTIVYLELHSDKVIDPENVLGEAVNAVEEYDALFNEKNDIDNLW